MKALWIVITLLLFHHTVVNAATIHARRGSCFHAVCTETVLHQLLCNAAHSFFTGSSTAKLLLADVHEAVQKCARGDDD